MKDNHSKIPIAWLWLTGAYAFIVLGIPFLLAKIGISFKFNEYGDWLAGTTAPVAVIWFILAYRLQMKEMCSTRGTVILP